MSAGHHLKHSSSAALAAELKRLLADPKVARLLKTRYTVDLSHEMPLTGGSTVSWGKFFLDPKLHQPFSIGRKRDVDLAPFVLEHEVVEKALRMALGMSYDRAHVLATEAEKQKVEAAGLDWRIYKDVMESLVRRNEHERPKSMPKDFDYGPLRASRGLKSLR